MFVAITNTPREYSWGSTTAIAGLLGYTATGVPEAELWLGTHPGSPALRVDGGGELGDLVPGGLPYLLKVLAAASPLSLQAHPTIAQAQEGFARENAAGVPLDASQRNYKDAHHKPELIVAVADGFTALCGFRAVEEVRDDLEPLAEDPSVARFVQKLVDDSSIEDVFTWLIEGGAEIDALLRALSEVNVSSTNWDIVRLLSKIYPGDPGIAISLLLNAVTLNTGEALYLPAGNIHAYINGLGIELMASSDNVLRGGLTPKHVDVPELIKVLDFRSLPVPMLLPVAEGESVAAYTPPIDDFALRHISGDAEIALDGPALFVCTAGQFDVAGASSDPIRLERGEAVYASADEWPLTFSGAGSVYLATTAL